jgi:hypothetical protein
MITSVLPLNLLNRSLSFLLIAFCLSAFSGNAVAESSGNYTFNAQSPATYASELGASVLNSNFAGGDGLTPGTAFQISTWEHLHNIRNVNGGYFQLINDLDENTAGYDSYAGENANSGSGWLPVLLNFDVHLSGSDGNGGSYTIKGLRINSSTMNTGLFSSLRDNSSVRDLKIDASVVTTNSENAGLIAGRVFGASSTILIENVHITNGVVNAPSANNIGGVIGLGNTGLTINNSSFSGNVIGNRYVGGIIGLGLGVITGSSSSGVITSSDDAGGLAGRKSRGSISQSFSSMTVNGNGSLGGLIGSIAQDTQSLVTVHQSYATGNVNTPEGGTGDFVGGLVGGISGGVLTEVFSTGDVRGLLRVGGITGELGINSSISDAFYTGTISSNFQGAGIADVGSASVSNVYATGNRQVFNPANFSQPAHALVNAGLQAGGYWNTNSGGAVNSSNGTGLSRSQFYEASNFPEFDFSASGPWTIIEGRSFPYLKAISEDFPPGYIFDFDVSAELSPNVQLRNEGETATIELTVRNDGQDGLLSDAEVVFRKENLSALSFSSATDTDSTWTIGPLESGQSASITINAQKTGSETGFLRATVSYLDQNNTAITENYSVKIAPPPYGMASAIALNGSDQYASTNISGSDAGFIDSSFAVDVWIKPSDLSGTPVILGQLAGDTSERLQLGLTDGKPYMSFNGDELEGNTTLQADVWSHLAFAYDAETMEQKIFLNGNADGSRTAANHFSGTSELFIGRGSGGYFSGQIDELRLWSTPQQFVYQTIGLDSSEFADLSSYYRFDANSGDILFNYKGTNATLHGSPEWVAFSGVPAGNASAIASTGAGNDASIGPAGDNMAVSGLDSSFIHLYIKGKGDKPLRAADEAGEQYSSENGFQSLVNSRLNTTFGLVPGGSGEITGQLALSYGTVIDENLLDDPLHVLFRAHPDSSWTPDLSWNNDTTSRVFTKSGSIRRGEYSVASFRVAEPVVAYTLLSMDDPNPNDIRFKISVTNQGPDTAQNVAVFFDRDENTPLGDFGSNIPEYNSTTNLLTIGSIEADSSKSYTFSLNYDNPQPVPVSAMLQQTGNLVISDSKDLTQDFLISAPPYGAGSAIFVDQPGTTGASGSQLGLVNSSFTVEAWVNPAAISGDQTILGQEIAGESRTLHLILRNGKIHMGFFSDDLMGQTDVPANTWSHIAFTYDVATNARVVYLNGVPDGSDTSTGPFLGEGNVDIGRWGGVNYLNGRIDELRVWNGVRTQAEIQANMHRTFSVTETDFQNLTAYFRFDESEGNTAYDLRNGFRASFAEAPGRHSSEVPMGQQAGLADVGASGNVGEAGARLEIENLSGSAAKLYTYGYLNAPLRNADNSDDVFDGLAEAGISARTDRVWGVVVPAGATASASVSIDFSSLENGDGIPESPGLIYRPLNTAAWQLLPDSLWIKNTAQKTFTYTGSLATGEYAMAEFPILNSAYNEGVPGWRMIGAPGPFARYSNILSDIWTQGFPGASQSETGSSNVYFYDEAQRSWSPPSHITNIFGTNSNHGSSSSGRGAIVYFYENQFPYNVRYSGITNAEEIIMQLDATVKDPDDSMQGWHLVSNPYPFPVDWTKVVADGLNEVAPPIFMYDANTFEGEGGYRVHYGFNIPGLPGDISHDGILAPFQAFFIRTAQIDGTPGTITFKPAHESTAGGGELFSQKSEAAGKTEPEYLLLSVESRDTGYSQSSLLQVAVEEKAQAMELNRPVSLVEEEMMFGIKGSSPMVLSQKTMEMEIGEVYQIPLIFDALHSGSFVFSIPSIDNWKYGSVMLTDHETGQELVLEQGGRYSFEHVAAAPKRAVGVAKAADEASISSPNLKDRKALPDSSAYNNARFTLTVAVSAPDDEAGTEIPLEFELSQNYPNPFNPATTIEYGLPESGNVRLEVFNLLGQRVATLFNGEQTSGFHRVQFDARQLASGIYLYRLQSGNTVITRKMMLLK